MKAFTPILLLFTFIGCDIIDPILVSGLIAADVTTGELLNASAVVLQQQGYTVLAADRDAGIVTTAWRDQSSFVDQVLLERSYRTRISVVVDLFTRNVSVQIIRQVKDTGAPWRNDILTYEDRSRVQTILSQILFRARAIHNQDV